MILVTGSLAYDYIMNFGGNFSSEILPESLDHLSVSFLVDQLNKYRGGTAGNIAYNLKLLGESPLLMATGGFDFGEYTEFLRLHGINDAHVTVLDDEMTASAFVTADQKSHQITMFHPGAMAKAAKKDLSPLRDKIKLAIIAPEMVDTMMHYVRECQKHDIPYTFDPGQNINLFSKEQIMEGVNGAKALIVNDYEWELFERKTGLSEDQVLEHVKVLIITLGEKGSKIFSRDETIDVMAVDPKQVQEPTGCGDAYRAGLLKGICHDMPLKEASKIASLAATYCVEEHGTQNHTYTWDEFQERLEAVAH